MVTKLPYFFLSPLVAGKYLIKNLQCFGTGHESFLKFLFLSLLRIEDSKSGAQLLRLAPGGAA